MSQQVMMENSYQLPSGTFPVSVVKTKTKEILEEKFPKETYKYDPKQSPIDLKEVTDKILKELKSYIPARYKYSVHVTLSEKMGQSFFQGSMCLWDPEHDNYATVSVEGSTYLVVAVIFGALLE
ncbi:tctex1 domain-containing protein 1 [Histomonas meleagridis]|uniref:tctex1 domain-containing protein 1 n=1 Tax=Histomonas meleagridis TaxID=135588 RepID=UPI00355A19B5|nr:tctex1 domain-containing protein 1 [Histomonas meleagridis]KAH0801425.1 tctex1 domain-containing protein 1 [Histomonas meleagridis]